MSVGLLRFQIPRLDSLYHLLMAVPAQLKFTSSKINQKSILPSTLFHKMISAQFNSSIQRFEPIIVVIILTYPFVFSCSEKTLCLNSHIDTHRQSRRTKNETSSQSHTISPRSPHFLKYFWMEAVLTTALLINRVSSKILNNQSPLQCLSSQFPDFGPRNSLLLKVFGYVSFVHIINK